MTHARLAPAVSRGLLVILLLLAAACGRNTEKRVEDGGVFRQRTVEPRLTMNPPWRRCSRIVRPGHVLHDTVCGEPNISKPPVSVDPKACDSMTIDYAGAIRTLVSQPDCTDAAVARLEALAKGGRDGRILSDLSAAYYVRGQRRDRPADLLRALDAAQRALEVAPQSNEARFNRALAWEALGFDTEAISSWDELRGIDGSSWGRIEAAAHHRELQSAALAAAATQWEGYEKRLTDPVIIRDPAAVANLVAPYPAAAQRYVEEEVLPTWAEAVKQRRPDEARRHLERASIIATQLARLTGDHYLLAVVTRVRNSSGRASAELQEAHLALRDGRRLERVRPNESLAHYQRALKLFTSAGSPAAVRVQIGIAITSWLGQSKASVSRAMLAAPEQVARARNYGSLVTRIVANRANLFMYDSRYVDSLKEYDAAIVSATRMNDRENIANMHARKMGVLQILGDKDGASREALLALRQVAGIVDVAARNMVLGQNALATLGQGYPAIALVYQNQAVRVVEEALSDPALSDPEEIANLQRNLGVALSYRAAIQLRLERHAAAEADLANAMRLSKGMIRSGKALRNALEARMQEVSAHKAMKEGDPARAVVAFTAAIDQIYPTEYRTYRAMLLMQRGDAHGAAGDATSAERDLLATIDVLREEQRYLLYKREKGDGESYWTPYFSRFREVYERVIRLHVQQGKTREAFRLAEQARAFEPLSLVLQLDATSDSFRRWTRDGETLRLETIQASLPENTFLIEFSVLPEQTYVWIVGRKTFDLVKHPVGRERIDKWSASIQQSAGERNADAMKVTLDEAYRALLGEALTKIRELTPEGELAKLVFVPDRSIHGLPLGALWNGDANRYVVQDHPVSIAASATFYVFSLLQDGTFARRETNPSALLIGDPAFDLNLGVASGLKRLPWALTEIDRIRGLYASAATILSEEQATVPNFLRLARQSTIVHFAGHAVANPDAPFRSLLLLAPSEDHSGALVAEELLQHFQAEETRLVVLSACSSAGGVPVGPEGLAPLVRPLIAAGVPAVVGTLWDVGDHASPDLLVAFHRHYRNGEDADRALRLAQLEVMRKKGVPGSVLAWAPFQVIGHASSPYR